jgi:hypothetical protein
MTKRRSGRFCEDKKARLVEDQWIPACPDIVVESTMAFCLYLGICFVIILPLICLAARLLFSAVDFGWELGSNPLSR